MKKKHDKRYTFLSTRERIELEKTKDILGEDYVKMVLSDMTETDLRGPYLFFLEKNKIN